MKAIPEKAAPQCISCICSLLPICLPEESAMVSTSGPTQFISSQTETSPVEKSLFCVFKCGKKVYGKLFDFEKPPFC